jgi:hypothetical protein
LVSDSSFMLLISIFFVLQIFADNLMELLLHFELVLVGELGRTYADIKRAIMNRWSASSLYDTTRQISSMSEILLADGFEKYGQELTSLEAGAIALQRAKEIDLQKEPSCVVSIPGSIARVCLDEEVDVLSTDISNLFVIRSAEETSGNFQVLYSDQQHIIAKTDDPNREIDEINARSGSAIALSFSNLMMLNEQMLIKTDRSSKRSREPEE